MPPSGQPPYHPPVKRSLTVAGHPTSISLEPVFWNMLRRAAEAEGVPVSTLVTQIDADRLESATPSGLAGAVRVWLVDRLRRDRGGDIAAAAPDLPEGSD